MTSDHLGQLPPDRAALFADCCASGHRLRFPHLGHERIVRPACSPANPTSATLFNRTAITVKRVGMTDVRIAASTR